MECEREGYYGLSHNTILTPFLPVALLFYQITPVRWRSYTLLIFSYLFFWSFSEKLIIYLIGTTFLTHHICIWMDTMDKRDKRKKRVLQLGIFCF